MCQTTSGIAVTWCSEAMPISLYNGLLQVEFEEKRHRYTVNGELWRNISSVPKAIDCGKADAFAGWASNEYRDYLYLNWPATAEGEFVPVATPHIAKGLIEEGRKEHNRRKEKAADIGTKVHDWIEAHIKAQLSFQESPALPLDEQERNAVLDYLEREKGRRIHYEATERIVASAEHRFIGRLDNVYILAEDGVRGLDDHKTDGGIRISFRPQLAAYAMAWNEENPEQAVWRRRINLLSKDGRPTKPYDLCYPGLSDEESTQVDFEAFLHALRITEWAERAIALLPEK